MAVPWGETCPRVLLAKFQCREYVTVLTTESNHSLGINGSATLPTGRSDSFSHNEERLPAPSTLGQHGSSSHSLEHGLIESGTNDRVTPPLPCRQADENHNSSVVASFSSQKTGRQPDSLLELSRPSSEAIVAGIRRQLARVIYRASVLASWRSTSRAAARDDSAVCKEMGGRSQPSLEPSFSVDVGYTSEDCGTVRRSAR